MVLKGTNSFIILGAWILWKHWNGCVFDGDAPSMVDALLLAEEEFYFGICMGLEVSPS